MWDPRLDLANKFQLILIKKFKVNVWFLISRSALNLGSIFIYSYNVLHKSICKLYNIALINSNQLCECKILVFRVQFLVNVGTPPKKHSFQHVFTSNHPYHPKLLSNTIYFDPKYTPHKKSPYEIRK